jgi:hypothetical protein
MGGAGHMCVMLACLDEETGRKKCREKVCKTLKNARAHSEKKGG